jgi:hypothetical protein
MRSLAGIDMEWCKRPEVSEAPYALSKPNPKPLTFPRSASSPPTPLSTSSSTRSRRPSAAASAARGEAKSKTNCNNWGGGLQRADALLRYEKTDFQRAVAAKFAMLEGVGNWQKVDAARSIEDVHVRGGGGVMMMMLLLLMLLLLLLLLLMLVCNTLFMLTSWLSPKACAPTHTPPLTRSAYLQQLVGNHFSRSRLPPPLPPSPLHPQAK